MAQIIQNPDGTYSRTYSDTELTLIKSLQSEIDLRQKGDQELWTQTTTLTNRIEALESGQFSFSDMQAVITGNIARLDEHDARLLHLEEAVIVDAYSKTETDQLITWKVEQIAHTFGTPDMGMFDKATLDDIRIGYRTYHHGDINEPHDNHVPENTMQRFTLWAYAATPKEATFNIQYADRCVVAINGAVQDVYMDSGGNFGSVPKVTKVALKAGWTRIQFLIANETQAAGLVVTSDLVDVADYVTNLDYFSGLISGNRIQAGSLDERHFSPNMDLSVHTLHATATDVPGVIVGNADTQGILQIGDGTITKAKDEPFHFDDGIRVDGFIRVTQLLIDEDFVRAGDGMIVDMIKDEFGYTTMYEIINDTRIMNGGGLNITGNGQQGFTITNDLQLRANPGLLIEGDPLRGYVLTNDMSLLSKGGLEVLGDAVNGYSVRNTMKLTTDYGIIRVEGNAWDGYTLKNVLEIAAGGGIRMEGSVSMGDVTIINDLSLTETTATGSINITGDAETGYQIEGLWPVINGQGDVTVTTDGAGTYAVDVDVHVQDVSKRSQTGNFLTVADFSGDHQIGIDTITFRNEVESIIADETHVSDVSERSQTGNFVTVTDNGGDHEIGIDMYTFENKVAEIAQESVTVPDPHVSDVSERIQTDNFVTVTDNSGDHEIGVDMTKFNSLVEQIVGNNASEPTSAHVTDVSARSETDNFITVTDVSGNHQLGIDATAFDDRVRSIAGDGTGTAPDPLADTDIMGMQAPWVQAGTSSTPNLGPGARWTSDNIQFAEVDADYDILVGYFSGYIPANTADQIRFTTQGGYLGSASSMSFVAKIGVYDEAGGADVQAISRSLYAPLGTDANADNYNVAVHTVNVGVADYWRHYSIRCYIKKTGGAGTVHGKFREAWTDSSNADHETMVGHRH